MQKLLYSKGKLEDKLILKVIRTAADDYECGAIWEARDALLEVVNAIDDFSYFSEKRARMEQGREV